LLLEDCIPNVFACLSDIGPSSNHELISDDSKCEVVNCYVVILPAHDLGCHIARSTRGVVGVVRSPHSRDAKVCYADVAIVIEKQVLRLDIPMYDSTIMHVLKSNNDTSDEELGFLFVELLFLVLVKAQVASCDEICHEEYVHIIGEGIEHVDQESVSW